MFGDKGVEFLLGYGQTFIFEVFRFHNPKTFSLF